MCGGMSISAGDTHLSIDVTDLIPSEDEPLSDRFPFKYSGVPIVSNTLRSFSVMCK
jgi:hypothetical protein